MFQSHIWACDSIMWLYITIMFIYCQQLICLIFLYLLFAMLIQNPDLNTKKILCIEINQIDSILISIPFWMCFCSFLFSFACKISNELPTTWFAFKTHKNTVAMILPLLTLPLILLTSLCLCAVNWKCSCCFC